MKPNPNAETIAEMLRVDHAGEYGANRIYEGQLMVLGKSDLAPTLKHMLEQEQEHLRKFDQLLNDNKVRPSVLMPLWHAAGLALGVGSALLGKKAAMACTVAVEEAIEEHYNSQIALVKDEELKKTITKFRDEEVEHRDTAIENKAREMAGYAVFSKLIKLGAKASIHLAKKFSFIIICLIASNAYASHIEEGTSALKQGNYVTAYNVFQPLAMQGNPDAQFALCGMYYNAQGVPKNDYEAVRWCSAAANNNNIEAMYNLGLMYQNGEGIGQNFIEAKRWYRMAAERGHQNAQYNLASLDGTMDKTAKEVAANIAANAQNMQIPPGAVDVAAASIQPNIPAPIAAVTQNQLPPMQLPPQQMAAAAPQQMQPPVMPQPIPQAQMPLSTAQPAAMPVQTQQPVQLASMAQQIPAGALKKPAAVKGGLEFIEPASGRVIRTVPDVEQPVLIVDNGSGYVDPVTACKMAEERGETYEICKKPEAPKQEIAALDSKPHSFGVEPDANFSTELELAKKGNTQAQNNLGMMYMTGVGVAKNYSEAMKWLERSASKGNTQAMMNLASMYRDGSGVLPNNELAYSWFNLAADRSTSTEDKQYASQNVQELSKRLSNEQIGNALEYVTKLDEKIPDTKTN